MKSLLILASLAAGAVFAADLPRRSPEFVINMANGEKQLLSAYRGKVVLCEFLFTTCPHCQHAAGEFSKLQDEFGTRGFQALGVAFNEMSNMLVPDFVRDYKPTFPVGWGPRESVMTYLGLKNDERFVVPQIVLMDRKGVIRFQSPPLGDPNLQDEKYLKEKINELLAETSGVKRPVTNVKPAAQTTTSVKRAPEVK
jgi:peroxiredoxin